MTDSRESLRGLTPGPYNAITDVPGVEVGHATDEDALTGATVVLVKGGAVAGVDVRGAAPGTRETDLLEPGNLVQRVQAIVLAGGSAYGLDAAGGVMAYLEERGLGQPVGKGRVVPIVPAAVIFDFEVGDSGRRPSADSGYGAAARATGGTLRQGNAGAGTGARAGGLKGGLGSASAMYEGSSQNGLVVGALVVVNSLGRVHDPFTGELYGERLGIGDEFGLLPPLPEGSVARWQSSERGGDDYADLFPRDSALAGRNTTIGVVATNAKLDKSQAQRVARAAHDGLARAIRPAHTMFDGDTLFTIATGEYELRGAAELGRLAAISADVVTRAVVHGVLAARSAGGLDCYRDSYRARFEGGKR